MAKEIEVKYQVKKNWLKMIDPKTIQDIRVITQGYLSNQEGKVVRVRLVEDGRDTHSITYDMGYITIKSPAKKAKRGTWREEFEYEIPAEDARYMLKHLVQHGTIRKIRYDVRHEGKVWEVDVYKGSNAGLITAELEMESLNEEFTTPPWVTADVSNNHKFSNSNLVKNPFSTWKH